MLHPAFRPTPLRGLLAAGLALTPVPAGATPAGWKYVFGQASLPLPPENK